MTVSLAMVELNDARKEIERLKAENARCMAERNALLDENRVFKNALKSLFGKGLSELLSPTVELLVELSKPVSIWDETWGRIKNELARLRAVIGDKT